MPQAQTRILILRTFKSGESNLILHGLNTGGAKMSFIARGAMASRKRFSGGLLEPTHHVLIHYQIPKTTHEDSPLHPLLEVELLNGFEKLRHQYERVEMGLSLVKLMAQLAQPGVDDSPELFNLLGNALTAAEESDRLPILQLHFEVRVLHALGVLKTVERFSQFLKYSLKDHHRVILNKEELTFLHGETKILLLQYINGLSETFNSL
ncbi:MAG: recombination protein O N-terminal domain-containing protein [Bdellovibrionales bacterium]|nr:recombination protein O N-terminal domain-containing protein [Bdellovibrionales bacterium]